MSKISAVAMLAMTMVAGASLSGQAREYRHHRTPAVASHEQVAPQRDFQAFAPGNADHLGAQQDPLDYRLGYFRNF